MLPGKLFLTISSGKCSKCLGLGRTEMKCPPLRTWMRKTKTRSTTAVLKSGFPQISIGISKLQPLAFKFFLWLLSFKLQVFQERVFECDQWPFIKIGACKSWLSTTPNVFMNVLNFPFFDIFSTDTECILVCRRPRTPPRERRTWSTSRCSSSKFESDSPFQNCHNCWL